MISAQCALVHTQKTLAFLDELSIKTNTLYTPTQQSIETIIDNCKNIINIAKNILQDPHRINRSKDNRIQQCNLENVVENDDSILDLIKQTANNVDKLNDTINMIMNTNKSKNEEHMTSDKIYDRSTKSTNLTSKFKSNRKTLENIKTAIQNVEKTTISDDSMIPELTNITSRLSDWYRYRIYELDKRKSKFRYHVTNIIGYMRAITFDYSISENKTEWLNSFDEWIDRLRSNDPLVSSYALPYDVFNTYRDIKEVSCEDLRDNIYFNSLWGMVIENGLHNVGDLLSSDLEPCMYLYDGGYISCHMSWDRLVKARKYNV